MLHDPSVSAVIPTRNRPRIVMRAIASALAQALPGLEVVVVVDGTDPAAEEQLRSIDDPRLQVVVLPAAAGPAAARNAGVLQARGEWIAFLDDDDEWLPGKLHRQLQRAMASAAALPVVCCRVIARTSRGDFVWPRHLPRQDQHLSDYLLDRRSALSRPGFVHTSTVLARRELLLKVRMRDHVVHQDWGWLLEATAIPGVKLEFVEDALSIYNIDEAQFSQAKLNDWQLSLSWIKDLKGEVTSNAYAAFVTGPVARRARARGDWRAFHSLLIEAYRDGRPKLRHLVTYIFIWLLPPRFHAWVRCISFRDAVRRPSGRHADSGRVLAKR